MPSGCPEFASAPTDGELDSHFKDGWKLPRRITRFVQETVKSKARVAAFRFAPPRVGRKLLTACFCWTCDTGRRSVAIRHSRADRGNKAAGRLARIIQCAVERLEFPAGGKPARQGLLQPEAVGAAVEVTKLPKPSMVGVAYGGSASIQAVTRVNVEQAPKRVMWKPTRLNNGEGRRSR